VRLGISSVFPFSSKDKGRMKKLDWVFLIIGVAPCVYILLEMERLQWTYGSVVLPLDIFFSILLMISLMELVRRAFGWAIPLTILGFLAYAFFGYLLPWGQMSFWGAKVIVSLFGAIPIICLSRLFSRVRYL
jgi:TRAP-type uncharacterized transport system fused permease subunit